MKTKDIINRKLEAAKAQIESLQKKVNVQPKLQKETVNTVPAGVPETPPDKNMNEGSIPGFITGGPKTSKKMKEV